MEIFLLAVISRAGLNTLYALQSEVSLQPGSIKQVLNTLEHAGLINRSAVPKGRRRRRLMSLTKSGEKLLTEQWRSSLDAKREIESILRGTTVALLMGDPQAAFEFLHRAAVARELSLIAQEVNTGSPVKAPIEFHTAMRAVYNSKRRTIEAGILRGFAEGLRKSVEGDS